MGRSGKAHRVQGRKVAGSGAPASNGPKPLAAGKSLMKAKNNKKVYNEL
jgi:hypothetical protein